MRSATYFARMRPDSAPGRRCEAMTDICRFSFKYTIREEDVASALRAHTRTFKSTWLLWIVFGALAAYGPLAGGIGSARGP